MARRLAGPHDVGKIRGGVIESCNFDARLVRGAEKRITRSQTGADDAELRIALRLEPIQAATEIDYTLAGGIKRPAQVGRHRIIRTLNFGGFADVVVRQTHT